MATKGILKKTDVKLRALSHSDKSRSVKHKKSKVGGGSGIKIAEPELTSQVIPAGTKAPGALLNAACGGPEGARPRDGPSNPGMRSGKAGCRIPADLKRGNGGEGTAQRRFCWPGAGGVGGAAGSAPDTFAVNAAPWMKRVRANGTFPPNPSLHPDTPPPGAGEKESYPPLRPSGTTNGVPATGSSIITHRIP